MKTIITVIALAVGVCFGLIHPASAAETPTPRGSGAPKLMERITTKKEAEALKPGDAIAMACTKCKSVTVTYVEVEKGHIKHFIPGEKHLCPGCKSTIEVVGVGRGKESVVKHVCKACGDESVFCCATKPGTGITKGMEKK